jgi:transcriptional regulator with XRE-family HTH domain
MADPAFASEWARTEAARNAGDLLIAARARYGLKQSELAFRAGVTLAYVKHIEAGDYAPPAERVAWLVASARRGEGNV